MSALAYVAIAALTVVIMGLLAFRLYCHRWPAWTGFGEIRRRQTVDEVDEDELVQPAKTLWDWLQLLVIPLALAGLAFLLNDSQTNREQRREDERTARQRATAADAAREEAMRGYLTQMSGLMLDRNLLRSRPDANVRVVARTLTLTTVRRLNPERKGVVVRFLDEARLLEVPDPKVELDGANLRSVELVSADLAGADLRGADLRRARLVAADLRRADLRGADLALARLTAAILRGADLRRASLDPAYLSNADLQGADLRGVDIEDTMLVRTDLRRADLRRASLAGANLRRANLSGADLRRASLGGLDTDVRRAFLAGADLRGADLGGANFSEATYNSTTRWPDGFNPEAAGAEKQD